jgi:tRNA uridine 5-carbamoylmethylation protein Kti12
MPLLIISGGACTGKSTRTQGKIILKPLSFRNKEIS